MQKTPALLLIVTVALLYTGCQPQKAELKTDEQKFSYIIGRNLGDGAKKQQITLVPEAFFAGMHDMAAGTNWQIPQPELEKFMIAKQTEISRRLQSQADEAARQGKVIHSDAGQPGH